MSIGARRAIPAPRAAWPVAALAAVAGLVAALLARLHLPPPVVALLVLGPPAVLAAALWPGAVAGLLLAVVLLQDWLVTHGLPVAQFLDEGLVLLGLAGLAVQSVRSGRLDFTPLDGPTAAFVLLGLVAAVVNDVPILVAALGLLALLKGLLAFQLFARARLSERAVSRGAAAVAAFTAAMGLLALAQRLGGQPVYALTGRLAYYLQWQGGKAPAVFTNHNVLGHVCALGGALALGLALASTGRPARWYAAAALACLAGLVVSASRESWLAVAVALGAVALATRSRRLGRIAVAAVLVLAVGGALVYFGSPLLRAEIARRGAGVPGGWHDYRLGFTGHQFRGEYRVYILLKSWEIWRDHLWLGTGPGRYGGHVATLYPSPVYATYDFLPLYDTYLPLDVFWSRLLTELGLLGAACYGLALFQVARIHWRGRRAPGRLVRGLATGGLLGFLIVLVLGGFAPALEDPLVAIPFWGWAGVVWALQRAAGAAGVHPG